MRNPRLHQALLAFAEEAAWQLASDAASGHEVGFELEERGRPRRTPLYCYRPLTADFIADRAPILGQLDGYLPALHALGTCAGLGAYLEARGVNPPRSERERAQETLYVFLARVFEDSTDFVLNIDRVRAAYDELETLVTEGRTEAVAVGVLLGVTLHGPQLDLGGGLTLVHGDALPDAPADAVWPRNGSSAHVLAVLRWEAAAGDDDPIAHARIRFVRLIEALRLYADGTPALGSSAWMRSGGGPWQQCVVGSGGAPRGRCAIAAEQEDELRAFCNLVARRAPRAGEVAWALRRFGMGCERADPMDGAVGPSAGAAGVAGARGARERAAAGPVGGVVRGGGAPRAAGRAHGARGGGGAGLRGGAWRCRSPIRWRCVPRFRGTCGRCCATCCAGTWIRICGRWRTGSWRPPASAGGF